MSEWENRPLGDVLDIIIDHRGKTPKKLGGNGFTDSGVPVVSAIHIKGGRIQWSGRERYVPRWMFEKWMPERLKRSDVLLTSEAPLGEVAQVQSDDDLVLSQRLFALRGKSGTLNSSFLRYFLETAEGQQRLESRASGTTVVGIRQAELVRIEVLLPPLGEQRRIASVLGAFDGLIEINRSLARHLENGVFAQFTAAGFDRMPLDKSIPLRDLVEVNPKIPKPSGEAPYINMAALSTDSSRITSVERRPAAGGARFQNGDSLLARVTPCLENGKAAYVDLLDEDEVAVGSTEFLVLRDRGAVGPHWAYVLSRSARFRDYAIRHMNGSSGRQRCSPGSVEQYPVDPPSAEDLRAFRSFADPVFTAISGLHEEIADLTCTRDELLPLLMSGKVRVEDVEILKGTA